MASSAINAALRARKLRAKFGSATPTLKKKATKRRTKKKATKRKPTKRKTAKRRTKKTKSSPKELWIRRVMRKGRSRAQAEGYWKAQRARKTKKKKAKKRAKKKTPARRAKRGRRPVVRAAMWARLRESGEAEEER
jgi:hypothetical protein